MEKCSLYKAIQIRKNHFTQKIYKAILDSAKHKVEQMIMGE